MPRLITALLVLSAALLLAGCGEKSDDAQAWNDKAAATDPHAGHDHAGHDHAAHDHAGHDHAAHAGQPGGKVLEAFVSGGYTYARLETPEGEIWAAGPIAELPVGEHVTLAGAMVMKGFTAASLDRTFDEIWFASGWGGAAGGGADPHADPQAAAPAASEPTPVPVLAPPADGYTVAAIHADRAELDGRRVKVRGQVVKALSGIMGCNWLHLQDGSGDAADGTHDLTVTTEQTAAVGQTVVIEGVVAADKDFGSGYFYTVIVEEANVTVEEAM